MFQQTPQKRVLFSRSLSQLLLGVLSIATILYGGFAFRTQQAYAATNSTINFQARLQGVNGNVAPDGFYNVQFKLYNVSTGGSALWTETYYDSNGPTAGNDNRIKVVNGYLSVALGSQTAFGAIDWDQNLYVTMNIGGTTQTATPTYDGEMSPRLALTAVPYSFRAGQLAIGDGTNVGTLALLQPTGGNQAFQIQNQGAAGTYNVCVQNVANANGGCAATTGGTGYVQNQNALQQANTNFWISGTGRADTSFLTNSLDRATAGSLNIGTTTASTIAIGNTTTATYVNIQSGTGGIDIGAGGIAKTINIGNRSTAVAETINIGNNATSGANTTVSIGTATGTSTTTLQAGTGNINFNSNVVATGSTLNTVAALADFPTGGAIGTAAATVDAKTTFTINQTTASQTLTIPSPTNAAAGRIVYISNIGSAAFTLLGTQLTSGSTITLVWNGSAWTYGGAVGSGSNVTLQAGTPGTANTGNFNVSGIGIAGTGFKAPSLDTAAAGALALGGTNATSVSLGNQSGSTSVSVQAGTGGVSIASGGIGNTVQIGNTSGAVSQTINIGTNATASSTNAVILGSTVGSTVTLQSSTAKLINQASGISIQTTTNLGTAFQVQNATGTSVLSVDTTTTVNLLAYASFEVGNPPTGWTQSGGATISQNSNKAYAHHGSFSLQVATGAANRGANTSAFTQTVTAGTYTVSFYAMLASGTMAGNLFTITSTDGATRSCSPVASPAVTANGFTRVSCSFTTTGNMTNLAVTQSDATSRTIYIDGIQLESGSTPTAYQIGAVQLRGVISNPVVFQSTSNSTNSLQVNGATGNILLNVDSLNNIITIGTAVGISGNLTVGTNPGSGVTLFNNGATVNATLLLGDFATGGSIGSANTTVDLYTAISVAQTTAGQAISIPSPTSTTAGRLLYIANTGSTSFTVGGSLLSANVTATLLWNGTAWTFAGADGSSIQNQNSVTQSSASFWISGSGRSDTSFLSSSFDTAAAGPLTIGTTNAGAITIGKNTNSVTLPGQLVLSGNSTQNNSKLGISGGLYSSTTTSQYGIFNQSSFNPQGASLNNIYGISSLPTLASTAYNLTVMAGGIFGIATGAGYTGQISEGYGVIVSGPTLAGSQLMPTYAGVLIKNNNANSGNTTGTIENSQLLIANSAAGAGSGGTMNNYGINLSMPTGSGGTTNNYGLYIQGAAAGASSWSLYNSSAASSYFGSKILVGTTSNASGYALNLVGTAAASSSVLTPTIDSLTAGALNIGTSTATSIALGGSTNTAIALNTTGNLNLGTNANNKTITIGASGTTNNTTAVNIGNTTSTGGASTIRIGGTGATGGSNTATTIVAQAGQVALTLANSGASLQSFTDSTTAFRVQNSAGASALTFDTTINRLTVNQGGLAVIGLPNPATPTLALSTTGGSLTSGTTYTYRLSAKSGAGETQAVVTSPVSTTPANSTSRNTLTWTAVTNATGYNLYRSTDGGTTWFVVALGSVTTYADNSNAAWTISPVAGYPSLLENRTGDVYLSNGSTIRLDTSGFGAVKYDPINKVSTLGSYDTGGYTSLQGDSIVFQDTTGYNANVTINNKGSVLLRNRINSTAAFQIQTAAGISLFNVDNSSGVVTIGDGTNNAQFNYSSGVSYAGTMRKVRTITLAPEYAGAVLDAASDATCSSAFDGTMTSAYDQANNQNYYKWTSPQAASQCYDVTVSVPLPSDFDTWTSSTPISIRNYASNTANATQQMTVRDSFNGIESGCNAVTLAATNATWTSSGTNCSLSGSYYADGQIRLTFRLNAKSAAESRISTVQIQYYSKF